MTNNISKVKDYFFHLKQISFLGRIYKKYISSTVLHRCSLQFGSSTIEVGSGIGSGILGAYPKDVVGVDINPEAVEYCRNLGLNAQLVNEDGTFPFENGSFDSCILDNVLEHIVDPQLTLDECYRITKRDGGLIIAVPGIRGFQSDLDHKKFYGECDLKILDARWQLTKLFSTPFFFQNEKLSSSVKQYCLVAVYRKV